MYGLRSSKIWRKKSSLAHSELTATTSGAVPPAAARMILSFNSAQGTMSLSTVMPVSCSNRAMRGSRCCCRSGVFQCHQVILVWAAAGRATPKATSNKAAHNHAARFMTQSPPRVKVDPLCSKWFLLVENYPASSDTVIFIDFPKRSLALSSRDWKRCGELGCQGKSLRLGIPDL